MPSIQVTITTDESRQISLEMDADTTVETLKILLSDEVCALETTGYS